MTPLHIDKNDWNKYDDMSGALRMHKALQRDRNCKDDENSMEINVTYLINQQRKMIIGLP